MWRKAKKALGVGLCVHLPAVAGDREDGDSERRASDAFSQDSVALVVAHASAPNTPAQAGVGVLRRSKSGAKSSKCVGELYHLGNHNIRSAASIGFCGVIQHDKTVIQWLV